jgi:hypothetical protein
VAAVADPLSRGPRPESLPRGGVNVLQIYARASLKLQRAPIRMSLAAFPVDAEAQAQAVAAVGAISQSRSRVPEGC